MKRLIQISKYYTELLRGKDLSQEWSDISECRPPVGTGDVKFLDYWRTETAYIDDLLNILESLGISSLTISDVEIYDEYKSEISNDWVPGISLNVDKIDPIIRSCLRGFFWCRLYYENIVFVRFGYDMYMHVGVNASEPVSIYPSNTLISHVDISNDLNNTWSYYFGASCPSDAE